MVTLTVSKTEALQIIQTQIDKGRMLTQNDFSTWKGTTCLLLERIFSDQSIAQGLALSSFVPLKGSSSTSAVEYLTNLVKHLNLGLYDYTPPANHIELEHFHPIIRRVLGNFYKHIEEMYQKPVHGRGTLQQTDLRKIVLGNEYDVQRMLFSLIRPIFPEARLEVYGDGGYKGYRSDIKFDAYDTIIEVKCSRQSMSERELTEQIAADCYQYKERYIYFFIYDKDQVIGNADAFCNAYNQTLTSHEKQIETFVIQPVRI